MITQQIVNEMYFKASKSVFMQCFANFRRNLGNLHIWQDICDVQMTNYAVVLITYGHCTNLLNNNDAGYLLHCMYRRQLAVAF